MSLREEIAAAEAYRDRLVAKANACEKVGQYEAAAYFDMLYNDTENCLVRLRAELDEEESRGGFALIARRLNLSEM